MADHILATEGGPELVMALLIFKGAACPKCGYATRRTSKRWARCKRCNERVERRALPVSNGTLG
jgi:predicted Zn-ribbon and HTH transcriptional regulator